MTTSAAPGLLTPEATPAPRLARLIDALRADVSRGLAPEPTARLVARTLGPCLGDPGLLTPAQRRADPACYRQHVLHAERDGSFSLVALVWLPGQHTPVHDHVSWCVTGVHEGVESERRYRLVPEGRSARLVATEDVVNPQGTVAAFAPPGDIHLVRNDGPGLAVSLHVYGADISRLGSSIRRIYDLPADR